jgi:hypothetical protein
MVESDPTEVDFVAGIPLLEVGDTTLVNDPLHPLDGRIGTVTGVYRTYRITFEDGTSATISGRHLDIVS